MKRHFFKWSVVLYMILLPYVCFSLSVPPANLPFFIGLIFLSACALITSKKETRGWKIICILAPSFAILGGAFEIVSGRIIKARLDHDREIPAPFGKQR
jgi:hypothetical protein